MSRRAMVGNAADEGQVADATRRVTERETQRARDLKAVMSVSAGRRFVRALLDDLHVADSPYRGDVYLTHLEIGRQDAGRQLLFEILAADPVAYATMQQEHQNG